MKIDESRAILSDDFAHRVVERVREVRRRRRIRRWVLTGAAACGAVAIGMLSISRPARDLSQSQPPAVTGQAMEPRSDLSEWRISSGEIEPADFDANVVSQPLEFFFPGATAVADFQSPEGNSWHSYDPWWNSGL